MGGSGSRIDQARARAHAARRSRVGALATLVFGFAFVGAKAHAPGHTKHRAQPLAAPASFEQAVRRSALSGGQIAPPVQPPSVVTSTSERRHRFRAMGCEIVLSGGDPAAVAEVFARWEGVFSRFLPGSELSRVNASPPGRCTSRRCSPAPSRAASRRRPTRTASSTRRSGRARARRLRPGLRAAPGDGPRRRAGVPSRLGEVRLDGTILRRPPGLQLDLNGVVKVSRGRRSRAGLPSGGFVSAGGDLAVRGPVDVGLPGGGAVRVVAGRPRHERCRLAPLAPRRERAASPARPADGPAVPDFALGAGDGLRLELPRRRRGREGRVPARRRRARWLDERGMPARFVAHDGEVVLNGAWHWPGEPVCT